MSATDTLFQGAKADVCSVCGAGKARRCNNCHSVAYCGKDCQVKDWKDGHKIMCCQLAQRLVDYSPQDPVLPAGSKVSSLLPTRSCAASWLIGQ
jgi:hypothetical protein